MYFHYSAWLVFFIGDVFLQASSDSITTCIENGTTDPASQLVGLLYSNTQDTDTRYKIQEGECKLGNPADYPPEYCPSHGEEFDFVIIGGGICGCVLANRLTEMPWTVLVIEAGGNPSKTSDIVGLYPTMFRTDQEWKYQTEPDGETCLGMVDQKCNYPLGKGLGGSTLMNIVSYLRGGKKTYDEWAKLGNTGWDFANCFKYFLKPEDFNVKRVYDLENGPKYHSTGGYLKIDNLRNVGLSKVIDAFRSATEELGIQENHDFNGDSVAGFGEHQATMEKRLRCSAAKAFLTPIKNRDNLRIVRRAFATRILFDESKTVARGVEFYNSKGEPVHVFAKKEVISSAGPINSPKLLMLSGIGPRAHLEEMGIEVVKDLPVAESFKDHPSFLGVVLSLNFSRSVESISDQMYKFLTGETSELETTGTFNWDIVFDSRDLYSKDADILMGLIEVDKGALDKRAITKGVFNFNDYILDQLYAIVQSRCIVQLIPTIVTEHSTGYIRLRSKDSWAEPKIYPRYLSNPEDIKTFLRCYDFMYKLASTKAMRALDAQIHELVPEACKQYTQFSDEARICALKHMTSTSFSYGGACKMGPKGDPTAVVDPYLKVIDIEGLRVADSSIMPFLPPCTTQAPTYMICEKTADLIKERYCSK